MQNYSVNKSQNENENTLFTKEAAESNFFASRGEKNIYLNNYGGNTLLAAKVQRNDSLARFLKERPQLKELVEKNILPVNIFFCSNFYLRLKI